MLEADSGVRFKWCFILNNGNDTKSYTRKINYVTECYSISFIVITTYISHSNYDSYLHNTLQKENYRFITELKKRMFLSLGKMNSNPFLPLNFLFSREKKTYNPWWRINQRIFFARNLLKCFFSCLLHFEMLFFSCVLRQYFISYFAHRK